MIKHLFLVVGILCLWLFAPASSLALYDPMDVPNNRLGVHILGPEEIDKAAEFVNGGGKEWGYVVVPIRSDDRDYNKWLHFFQKTKERKIIPVIRVATYAQGTGWALPDENDILHTAQFLEQMPWPTENRYVILFNEPNHAGEWGGKVDPESFARITSFGVKVFKNLHSNFFVLPAAMDRAAPNGDDTMKADVFLKKAVETDRTWLDSIDGWNSHAYPNPAFAQAPSSKSPMNVESYTFEQDYLKKLGKENMPIFITETGWSNKKVAEPIAAHYWQTAWNDIWDEQHVVLVTAWLLQANDGPFQQFTLVNKDNSPNLIYQTLQALPRIAGAPVLVMERQSASMEATLSPTPSRGWTWQGWKIDDLWHWFSGWWLKEEPKKTFPTLTIGNQTLEVELAEDDASQRLGLGHRTSLGENSGMLFMYPQTANHGFWMKHTLIPLDMIWIRDNVIVDIIKNVPVEPDPVNPKQIYYPQSAVNWVLEVNGGWSDRHGVKVGDKVELAR